MFEVYITTIMFFLSHVTLVTTVAYKLLDDKELKIRELIITGQFKNALTLLKRGSPRSPLMQFINTTRPWTNPPTTQRPPFTNFLLLH